MINRIETIRSFYGTRSFGTPANLLAKSKEATQAYRDLSDGEVAELITVALAGGDDIQQILGCLACLHPGSLKRFQPKFIERQIFLPGLIYHDADEECAHELADLIPSSSTLGQNHLLLCMAWAGNAAVQKLFSKWRDSPPSWVADLHVPPQAYANEAGWELLPNGERHDLFFKTCMPLVKPSDSPGLSKGVAVGTSDNQPCPWCGNQFVALLDFDLTNEVVLFMRLAGTRLRVTACHVCSCYGTVLSKNDGVGGSVGHSSNVRPEYLPEDSSDWPAFPEQPLVLSGTTRHFMESASWTGLPSAAFSQIGGLPTWIQDAEFPDCPECERKMLFIGQVSNEDYDQWSEGIYYCFVCPKCNVTATTYQQS